MQYIKTNTSIARSRATLGKIVRQRVCNGRISDYVLVAIAIYYMAVIMKKLLSKIRNELDSPALVSAPAFFSLKLYKINVRIDAPSRVII